MDKMIVARRIKHYRRTANMSQETLAEAVGVSDTYIRKLENGERFPSLEKLVALADALDTTPNHLLLSSTHLSKREGSSILDLLNDCTPTEFIILYENMSSLKESLRNHIK
ncbi:MAG: helix-turn-helix transcriptional regulator [Lachnospiraceae bacterium]|nr:helix-turn-helix transcriptional regulator [Lachnospiraceae bacterium]